MHVSVRGERFMLSIQIGESVISDPDASPIAEAHRCGQHVIFVNDIATARAFEHILIWIFRSKNLINEAYIPPEPALLPLTVQLLSQLDNPTMGCQVWLDASEIRPFNCGLVLPPEIQRRFTRNILEVPIGIFKDWGDIRPMTTHPLPQLHHRRSQAHRPGAMYPACSPPTTPIRHQ